MTASAEPETISFFSGGVLFFDSVVLYCVRNHLHIRKRIKDL